MKQPLGLGAIGLDLPQTPVDELFRTVRCNGAKHLEIYNMVNFTSADVDYVSELSEQRISHPRQYVSEGQDLLLRIIRIDPQL